MSDDEGDSKPQIGRKQVVCEWPERFPGYRGVFTYEVDEAKDPKNQKDLGNGVFLWQLEIMVGTVQVGRTPDKNGRCSMKCQMEKRLIQIPSDASAYMKAQKGNFVVEEWNGSVDKSDRTFSLSCAGGSQPPVKTTFDFSSPEMPLTRPALAGEYQLRLESAEMVTAVHSSWVEFANLKAEQAIGFLLHIDTGSSVCPMLRPPGDVDLDKKLREIQRYLQSYTAKYHQDALFSVTIVKLQGIETVEEVFRAEVEVDVHFMVSREDVVRYVMSPKDWKPSWQPDQLKVTNPSSTKAVQIFKDQTSLEIRNNGVWASQKSVYAGTFHESLELEHFPFDVQWLHVKLEADHSAGNFQLLQKTKAERMGILKSKWRLASWSLTDVDAKTATISFGLPGEESAGQKTICYVGCKVKRTSFGVLMRTMFVMFLVIGASLCPFVLHPIDALSDRLGLIFTMMLTAAAYSTVVADSLPSLGYLTFLDIYILGAFAFFTLEAFQMCLVALVGLSRLSDEGHGEDEREVDHSLLNHVKVMFKGWDESDLDYYCVVGNILLILFMHVALTLFFLCYASVREDGRLMDHPLDDEMEAKESTSVGSSSDSDCEDSETQMSRPLMSRSDFSRGSQQSVTRRSVVLSQD